ncbi:MAG TPA: kinase [Caulobacteraceae bacterium]|jgi:D-glycerate 3-kinase|nr:kinase [Caulobacteraceae bacterium]
MTPDLSLLLRAEGLPETYEGVIRRLHVPLAARIAKAARAHGPGYRVGLCGPQGSGKTTSARVLERLLAAEGLRAVILSLDDLYLPLAARRRLAARVHPLFITRGVPGTHDVALGLEVLASLPLPGLTMMPRFDKASDDRVAPTPVEGPADVILFEGWCVGARPQDPAALARPVNALERQRDPEGVWRAYANTVLAGPYQDLFADFGLLALFKVPSFEVVLGWRQEQERKAPRRGMTDAEIAGFIRHYQRLTDWIQAEMPARADVVAHLAPDRAIGQVRIRGD